MRAMARAKLHFEIKLKKKYLEKNKIDVSHFCGHP